MISEQDFVRIEITENMLKIAKQIEKDRWANGDSRHIDLGNPMCELHGALGELAVFKFLRFMNGRKCEMKNVKGSDGGRDILIKSGWINVKASYIEPKTYFRLIVPLHTKHDVDFFAQCFVRDDAVYFVGMENRSIIDDRYKETITNKKNSNSFEAYTRKIKDLSIKPIELLSETFTLSL